MTTGLGIATIPARPAESVGARSVSGVTQERMPLFRCGPPAQRPQSMPVARPLPIACMLRLTPAAFVRRSARQPCAIGRVKLDDGPWSHLAARSECKEIPVSLPQFSRIAETAAKLASDLLPCCAARRWAGRSAFLSSGEEYRRRAFLPARALVRALIDACTQLSGTAPVLKYYDCTGTRLETNG